MKRNFISLLALMIAAQVVLAVDPNTNLSTYYSSIDGKSNSASSDALRTQLCTVISTGYVSTGYSSLPNSIYAASTDPSDFYNGSSKTMEDIYSSYPYTSSQSGSSATTCGTGWNKEHTVPQSYFGEASPMKSDAHHVFPTDIKMNSVRSNYPYGENNASKDCSTYGYGHLGTSTFAGYSGTVFDPGEGGEYGSYKGDLARVYFYMVTRYRTTDFTNGSGSISFTYTSGVANLTDYMKNLMLKWHRQDPVSEKERIRNNAIYAHQKNRNPYVDYPCLVEYIWGEKVGESVELSALVSAYDASYTGNDCSGGGVEPLEPDYYAPVEGLSDSLLKSKLAEVTWSHYTKRYSYGSGKNNTWDAFWYTDRNEADNSVVDMYSNNKRYFNPSDMTASVTDCDIEHMFPNSWFGGKPGNAHAYCDLHHLVPSDYSANRSKSNRGPGVPTDTTFNNGVWVNGKDAGRDNLEVFCPPDEYKGDFARAFFYIAMAYGDTAVWQAEAVPNHMTNSDWHEFLPLTRDLLLEWHRNDPVSEKERVRMNTVYGLQGNRNPFIDYPCLAEYIWGVRQGEAFNLDCSDTPVPPTKYTITWSVDGKKSTSEVTKGLRPSAPSVTDCSESRVFVGWTTSSTVSEKPAELYTAATIPAASKAATYYAVYADKETEDGGGEFALYSGDLTEGDYVIYYGGKAMKATVASNRLGYAEVSVSADKIATEDASIIWHLSQTNGYWRIYNAGENSYAASTGVANKAQLLADGSDDHAQWTVSGTATYEFVNKANAAKSINANLRNNGTYGFACYATQTGGALSLYKQSGKVTYTNYGLSCSTAKKVTITYHSNDGKGQTRVQETLQNTETELETNPFVRSHYSFEGWSLSAGGSKAYNDGGMIVPAADVDLYAVWKEDPKFTLTFWNGEAVYMSVTDYAGEAIEGLTDPESCERYSFVGWSTMQYSADNTAEPEVSTPTIVPALNVNYYAVYTKTDDAGTGLTNQYKKIISKAELTDANYLVVADTSKLLAMSTDWKNTYYLGSVEVTENEGVITTENSKIIWQIDENAGTITLNNSAAGYLYIEQSVKNEKTYYNIKLGDNTETNKFAYTVSEGVWVFSSATYSDRQLEFYTKKAYWSYYNGQDAPIYLYKQQEGIIQKTYYTTTLDCSISPATALETEEVRIKARKMLINGQMYIVLDDRVYDVTGQRVR